VRLGLGAACQVVLVVGVMLASVGQVRAEAVAKTHCKPKEQVVFSCVFKNNKTVSLCASEDLSQDKGVLQYRYGLLGKKLELEYPQLIPGDDPIYTHPNRLFHASVFKDTDIKGEPIFISKVMFTPFDAHPAMSFIFDVRRYSKTQQTYVAYLGIVDLNQDIKRHYCRDDTIINHLEHAISVFKRQKT